MAPRPEAQQAHAVHEDEAVQQPDSSNSGCPIDRLNAEVRKKMEGGRVPIQLKDSIDATALLIEEPTRNVYHRRALWAVIGFWVLSAYLVSTAPSVAFALASVVMTWLFVDFYGAVLHVVLDHSPFSRYPIIGEGALEFQWHHAMPHDITSKPYLEVCGDLNYVALLHVLWHAVLFGFSNPAANTIVGAKTAMAYLGQWSHRMAHTPAVKRPTWVHWAQKAGILVSPELHKEHHTTYNDGFPILSGFTAPLIAALVKAMPNRHAWLVLFAVMSLTDIWMMYNALTAAFAYAGYPVVAA